MGNELRSEIKRVISSELEELGGEDGYLCRLIRDEYLDEIRRETREALLQIVREEVEDFLSDEKRPPSSPEGEGSSFSKGGSSSKDADSEEIVDGEDLPARYLYCVMDGGEGEQWDRRGLEGRSVYTISYKELSAVVHDSPLSPYDTQDQEQLASWVREHQQVVDLALRKKDAVIPAGFDTIFKPQEDSSASEVVQDWLREEYDQLNDQLEKIDGKREYGVQIIHDRENLRGRIKAEDEEIAELAEQIESKPEGQAYLYKERLSTAIEEKVSSREDDYRDSFLSEIRPLVDEVNLEEKVDPSDGEVTLVNASCLLPAEEEVSLGNKLEEIDDSEGFRVRFTGPWAPYSFVDLSGVEAEGKDLD